MKKFLSFLIGLLFLLTVLYPAGALLAACFGYRFEPMGVSAFSTATAVLFLLAVAANVIFKNELDNKAVRIVSAFITPLTLVHAVLCIFACPQVSVIVGTVFSACCSAFLTVKHGKPPALKAAALVLSALLVLPVDYLGFIALVFGNIGQNTVVQTVASPNGEYYAQVIDSDQGALGGDTLVEVHKKGGLNCPLFKAEKKPQRVWVGEWGAFADMRIYWKSEDCLVINSVEYTIR